MKVERINIQNQNNFQDVRNINIIPDLLFVFGERSLLLKPNLMKEIRSAFPEAIVFGCSSAGEISGIEVKDSSVSITAVKFEKSHVKLESISLLDYEDGIKGSEALIKSLSPHNLKHVMLFSDGLNINGAKLVEGIEAHLPSKVRVTGGLAADGTDFKETVVFDKNGNPSKNCIAALGFYGDQITIGYGSNGGWDSFGLERLVTKSKDNILFELDGKPALELYKSFLGERASELPASGLLFPLSLRENGVSEPVVRTILGINEEEHSLIFAGDIPEGSYVKLMKANVDRLISGAESSAITTTEMLPKGDAELAILISCVGRKLVLKQLIEEEVEAVADVVGKQANITGFYSYGEISPFRCNTPCLLHNQTMTITTISEK